MEAPELMIERNKTALVNKNIDALSDTYIGTILIKLRAHLRKGPFNDNNEPYNGAILRGKFTPFVINRFEVSPISTLRPGGITSYFAGKTFILPDHVLDMLLVMQSSDMSAKEKLKLVYQTCEHAVVNKSTSRVDSTHYHYTASRRFIEIMVDPLYQETYQKIKSTEFRLPDGFLDSLKKTLLEGPKHKTTSPYNVGLGGITIQTDANTSVTVPRHVDELICEINDVLPDDRKKAKNIFLALVDASVSHNLSRDESTQQFYETLLKEFAQQINTHGNGAQSDNEQVHRL